MQTPRSSGFTLSELLVGLVVTSITLVAVAMSVISVQRSYQAETSVKVVTENGRTALEYLERVLPLAGYGLDPRIAFDVTATVPGGVQRDNAAVGGVLPATTPVVTDDLAFRYRDPAWLRAGRLNAGATSLTLDTAVGVALPVGKLLMVACRGGVDVQVVAVQAAVVAGDTALNVAPAPAPFVNNTNNCLTVAGAASPWVFLVHEHRLRIVNLGGRPWLVAFRDLTADVTVTTLDNFDPIAADVENFQVAFGMNRPAPGVACCQGAPDATGNSNWIIGDSLSPMETVFAQPGSVLTTLPRYRTGYTEASRYTLHPANIRSIHVSFVSRSSRVEPTGRRMSQTEDLFNYDAPPSTIDGYYRTTFHTAIAVPNMLSRSFFVPSLRSAADARDLNSWGG